MTIEAKIDETNLLLKQLLVALGGKQPAPPAAAAPTKAADKVPTGKDTITYENVKTAFLDLVKNKTRDVGVAVLKEFGAEKLPDVKPEKFKDLLAAIKKAAEAKPADATTSNDSLV